MKKEELKNQLLELKIQVEGFFGRKTKEVEKKYFKNHRENILEVIKESAPVIRKYPVYGAIAFLGKFRFDSDCPKVKSLSKGTSEKLLREIQGQQSVQLAESARDAWSHLTTHEPETACVILALCYMASSSKTMNNCL